MRIVVAVLVDASSTTVTAPTPALQLLFARQILAKVEDQLAINLVRLAHLTTPTPISLVSSTSVLYSRSLATAMGFVLDLRALPSTPVRLAVG